MTRPQVALAVGKVGYNGFQFPHIFQLKISGRAVEDAAGRTTKYTQWTTTAEWTHISEDGPVTDALGAAIDDDIEKLREILTAPGKELAVIDQGFGDLIINKGMVSKGQSSLLTGEASVLDSAYGPKTTFEGYSPVASNRAGHINWTCIATIPECGTSPADKDKLSEWTYSVRFSINTSRMTTRTISGSAEIPATRKTGTSREIQNTIDAFRESVDIPRLPGFHRSDDYGISPDKRRLEFAIVDTEIQSNNEYFPGMIKMDISHGISTNMKEVGFRSWANTLSGSVEVAPDAPLALGWVAIQAVINQRLSKAREGRGLIALTRKVQSAASDSTTNRKSAVTIISAFSIQEALFGRTVSFSLTYMVTTDLKSLIKATGLFSPLGVGDWQKWSAKISAITGVRGFANLSHGVKDDIILDLCGGTIPKITDVPLLQSPSTSPVPGIDTGTPGPSNWLAFSNNFFIRSETNVVVLQGLTTTIGDDKKILEGLREQKAPDLAKSKKGTTLLESIISGAAGKPTIQARSPQTYTLVMQGFASKVGFDFPIPSVVKVGGSDAIRKSEPVTEERSTADMQGQIIYSKKWRKEYILDGKPEGEIGKTLETDGIPTDIPI